MDLVFQSAEGFELVGDSFSIDFTRPLPDEFQHGCNMIGGEYGVVDGVFEMSVLHSTYMDCETPLMDQDSWLSTFFLSSPTIAPMMVIPLPLQVPMRHLFCR